MQLSLRYLSVGLGVLATTVLVYDAFKIVRALRASASPELETVAYTVHPEDVGARLLVLGDSTAVGTGARAAQDSVAGRLGAAVPRLRIDNQAVDGARVRDLQAQIAQAAPGEFDVVLVQIGGNDMLRWTGLGELRRDLDAFLAEASRRAGQVVLIAPGLVGRAPAIPWPLNYVLNSRARRVRSVLRGSAEAQGVHFVDLVGATAEAGRRPKAHYAADGLHPSGEGYGAWYRALVEQVPIQRWLDRPATPFRAQAP